MLKCLPVSPPLIIAETPSEKTHATSCCAASATTIGHGATSCIVAATRREECAVYCQRGKGRRSLEMEDRHVAKVAREIPKWMYFMYREARCKPCTKKIWKYMLFIGTRCIMLCSVKLQI